MSLDDSPHVQGRSSPRSTRPALTTPTSIMSGHSSSFNPNPPPGRLGPNHDEFPSSPKHLPLEHPHAGNGSSSAPTTSIKSTPPTPSTNPSTQSHSSPSTPPYSCCAPTPPRGASAAPVSIVTASLEADEEEAVDEELEAKFKQQLASRGWRRIKRQRDAQSPGDVATTRKVPRLSETVDAQNDSSESSRSAATTPLLPPPSRTFRQGPIVPADPATLAACQTLEVDEGFCDEDGEEPAWHDTSIELLRQTNADGFRQLGPLRYRGAGQYTSRTQPVVRHRPRMRRRKDLPARANPGPAPDDTN